MPTSKRMSNRHRALRKLMVHDGMPCALCGLPVKNGRQYDPNDPLYAQLDHKVAQARGGRDARDNYQVVHKRCNAVKGSKDLILNPVTSRHW